MGYLNNKQRVFDTIITREGRRQIASGDFVIRYAAFSDRSTFYQGDVVSGTDDASNRLFVEPVSLVSDRITFEADDAGRLLGLESSGTLSVFNGKIISGSAASGNRTFVTSSTAFSSLANDLLSGSFQNFDKLRVIGTQDFFGDEFEFRLSDSSIKFEINDEKPISESEVQSISIEKVDSFFSDKRLSHIPNFQYLPPRNSPTLQNQDGSLLGEYTRLNQNPPLTIRELRRELQSRTSIVVPFSKTSRQNNIFSQFFEVSPNNVTKLEVIDFGTFPDEDGEDVHVFFVGKVYVDDLGRNTFVNLFTVFFE
jgi:hypothetical protein